MVTGILCVGGGEREKDGGEGGWDVGWGRRRAHEFKCVLLRKQQTMHASKYACLCMLAYVFIFARHVLESLPPLSLSISPFLSLPFLPFSLSPDKPSSLPKSLTLSL
jgi:hypothetical protein